MSQTPEERAKCCVGAGKALAQRTDTAFDVWNSMQVWIEKEIREAVEEERKLWESVADAVDLESYLARVKEGMSERDDARHEGRMDAARRIKANAAAIRVRGGKP